ILVERRKQKKKKGSLLQFRGSRNQRILDVPKSLAAGEPIIWAKLHDQERDIPSIYLKDREAGEDQQAS
ncbi:anaerobic ribonucleoside-triphosphate reductase activating protein, partial [Fusicatenibacter saccharivorans]|nr:anaerobic ribonucleoside-triphosphate reductase activating protein [Fusicatenibacter saccharivorans]